MNITTAASALLGTVMAVTASSSGAVSVPQTQCLSPVHNVSIGMRDAGSSDVTALQEFLQAQGYLKTSATGYFGPLTLKAVEAFQLDNDISATGYVGILTRARIAQKCTISDAAASTDARAATSVIVSAPAAHVVPDASSNSSPNTGSLSVSGIDAPTTLVLGSIGMWTVYASETGLSGGLHYVVDWGDSNPAPAFASQSAIQTQSSATFTHVYNQAGAFQPTFTVTDDNGNTASASTSVVITPEQ